MGKSKSGIHIKASRRGLLHKNLKVGEGEKIPVKDLEKAKRSESAAVRKRAVFALNARKWRH